MLYINIFKETWLMNFALFKIFSDLK